MACDDGLIWTVYLVRCSDGTLYCGTTTNISRRLAQHNGQLSGGAKYTATRRPVCLEAYTDCFSRAEALRLEAAVRRRPRQEKVAFLMGAGGVSFLS